MGVQVKNNAVAKLATGVNNTTDFQFSVESGKGDLFPVADPGLGDPTFFYVTLEDSAKNVEIWKITSRAPGSDVLSAQNVGNRAQDGTTMRDFVVGDIVECRVIAKLLEDSIAHVGDTSAAHAASAIGVTPAGGIAATDVQAALQELDNEKAAASHTHAQADVTGLVAALNEKAPISSPSFTGTPNAPTPSVEINSSQLATTAYVITRIANDAPTKSGVGATGTWPINISGNANTANSAANGGVTSVNGLTGAVNIGVGESNTASNQGSAGVGVFLQKSGVDLQFKNITGGNDVVGGGRAIVVTQSGNNILIQRQSPEATGDSLHPDSRVEMADIFAFWRPTKFLRDIRVGDVVRGRHGAARVLGIWTSVLDDRPLCEVRCAHGAVACTPGHLFVTRGAWGAVIPEQYRRRSWDKIRVVKGKGGMIETRCRIAHPDKVVAIVPGMELLTASGDWDVVRAVRQFQVEGAHQRLVGQHPVIALYLDGSDIFFADGYAVSTLA